MNLAPLIMSLVLIEFIKMSVKDKDCERHLAAYFTVVHHQGLSSPVISQEVPNH